MNEEIQDSKKESKFVVWMKTNFTTKAIATNAIIAALYAVVTIACGSLSYSYAQFRISELLNLMVFFNPTYTLGLTLGCFIANIASTAGMYDMIFGTLATLISCLLMIGLSKLWKNLFFSSLIPSIVNAIIVPFVIYLGSIGTADAFELGSMYWIMFGWIFLGEFVCITCIGYPLFMVITKKFLSLNKVFCFTRNLDYKR